jgi:hypothetical protein
MILALASFFDPLAKSVFALSCLRLVRLVVGLLWCAESFAEESAQMKCLLV